jgi:nickel/cobalt transporter (NicO) family protein
MDFLIGLQRWIYGTLSAELGGFAVARDWTTLATVLPLGIVFGAIHALTPGHGKTVLASYLVGSPLGVLRSLAVAGTLALTHVVSAVILALLAAPLVIRTVGGVGRAPVVEKLSRGALGAIGLWLLMRAFRGRSHHHHEGMMVGFVAGLVPCPLTLFVMFFALARGIPEAGVTFAIAMMIGIALTLAAVAAVTVVARAWLVDVIVRRGASIDRLSRILDGVSGALLIVIALVALLR